MVMQAGVCQLRSVYAIALLLECLCVRVIVLSIQVSVH